MRPASLALALALSVGLAQATAACSGGERRGPATPGGGGEGGGGASAPGEGARSAGGGGDDVPLTEAECAAFLDHVIDLELDAMRKELDPEEIPTPEQVAALRERFRAKEMAPCLAQPRRAFECAMQAGDQQAAARCADAPGRSP